MPLTKSVFVSVDEAAEIIGCTTGRIRQLLRSGDLRGEKLNERAWAVHKGSAQEYAKKSQKTGRPRSGENS